MVSSMLTYNQGRTRKMLREFRHCGPWEGPDKSPPLPEGVEESKKFSRGIESLISDAEKAGLVVIPMPDGSVVIRKGKSPKSVGITIWPDGTATRSDVDLALASSIRTVKQMRGILGLKEGVDTSVNWEKASTLLGEAIRFLEASESKTLYVSRDLLNSDRFLKWARSRGFGETLDPSQLHVTVAYSKKKVHWGGIERDANELMVDGGFRRVAPLGDDGAIVLFFESNALAERHEEIKKAGASWDYPSYHPHVTITYSGEGVDLKQIDAYQWPLRFSEEKFAEIDSDWDKDLIRK